MKKLCSALLVLFLCGTGIKAADMMSDIKWAVVGGVNYSQFSGGSPAYDLGFALGGAGMLPIDQNSGVAVALLFDQKNGKQGSAKEQVGFLHVPVLYHYMFNPSWGIYGGGFL